MSVTLFRSMMAFLPVSLALSCASANASRESVSELKTGHILSFQTQAAGFDTQNFFYDDGKEVVVFDTQFTPELAQQSLDFIRSKTSNPISYVVITHPNPDKFNGASVFQAIGAKVIASKRTEQALADVHAYKKYYFVTVAKMFAESDYPALANVDITFDSRYTLSLKGGGKVELWESGVAGVTTNQTVAYVPKNNSLFVGDLIHNGVHAWLEGGIVSGAAVPTLDSWSAQLAELVIRYPSNPIIFGGRGKQGNLDTSVKEQVAYLKKADSLVSDYIKALGSQKEELSTSAASKHYADLTRIFEKEFPERGLSYLIQFGVYGLVNARAKSSQ